MLLCVFSEKREVIYFLDVVFVAGDEHCTCMMSESTSTLNGPTFLLALFWLLTKLTNEPFILMCYLAWSRTLLDSEKILNFWYPVRLWMLTSFPRHVLINSVIIDYSVARRTGVIFVVSRASKGKCNESSMGKTHARRRTRFPHACPTTAPRFPRSPENSPTKNRLISWSDNLFVSPKKN